MKINKETLLKSIDEEIEKLQGKVAISRQGLPALVDFFHDREVHFCYFYPEYAKVICSVATRADFAPIRALHTGVWDKEVETDHCTYRAKLASGIELVCEVRELPPSCKVIEKQVLVPAMPEHTITRRHVECPKTKEELVVVSEK